jgi:hypothetical protein
MTKRSCVPGAMQHEVLLRRIRTVTAPVLVTAPALQRTASQLLRVALRPGYGVGVKVKRRATR